MKFNRRDFLKLSCFSVAGFAVSAMGCSSKSDSDSSASKTDDKEEKEGAVNNNPEASNADNVSGAHTAVVFFSCTGNTEMVAEKIVAATHGELMRIEPAVPYTSADLDYNSDCRANAEQNSGSDRPALAAPVPELAACDVVYLGYPIWWGKAPRIILTFLESADFAGKTIVPFCTSGSSPISGSMSEIKQAAPGSVVLEGRRFSASASQQEIDSWVSSMTAEM